MFFHVIPLVYTLIYLMLGEIVIYRTRYSLYLIIISALFALWSTRKISKRYSYSFIPIIFSFSTIILLYLVDSIIEKQVVLGLGAMIFYLIYLGNYRLRNYSLDQTARGLIATGAATTLFLFFSSAYGFYLNFQIPLWGLMLSFLAITLAVSYQYLRLLTADRKKCTIYSFILAMISAEIAWVINFWPFGYLTTGMVALIFYYVLWDLTQSHFLNKLSKKRMIANIVFFSLLIALILASSSWLPLV